MSGQSAARNREVLLAVQDRDGRQHSLAAYTDDPLMFALRDADLGIEASCDGGGICATCHIYLPPEWADRIPPPDVFEQMQLDGLVHGRSTSRLACQINVTQAMADMKLTIAPEEL